MANSKKKFELRKIIEIETIIAAILISVASLGIAKWYDFDTAVMKTRQEVFNQYSISKNLIIDGINLCLSGEKTNRAYQKQRLKNRELLVQKIIANAKFISPSAYFSVSTFTRLDNAQSLQNLCSLSKKDLKNIRSKVFWVQTKLWEELDLRPSS